jgi:hypothetical protein
VLLPSTLQIEASKVTVTAKEHARVSFAAKALKVAGGAGSVNVVGISSALTTPASTADVDAAVKRKKRRGPKQPNPLSIKKKKQVDTAGVEAPKKKRRRKIKKNEGVEHAKVGE